MSGAVPAFAWMLAAAGGVLACALAALAAVGAAAIASASRRGVAALSERGNPRAARALLLIDRRPRDVATLRATARLALGVGAALAAALGAAAGPAGAATAAFGAFLAMSALAEALPRAFARAHPERALLATAPVLASLLPLLDPAAGWFAASRARLAAAIGRSGAGAAPRARIERAEEALRGELDRHASPVDAPRREERQMLRSVLDLGEVTVGKIMIHRNRVTALDIDQAPASLLEQALASPHTRIPLYRGSRENIVGVMHARALLRALRSAGGRAEDLSIAEIAARPWFVPDTTTLLDQLRAFRRRREHFAVVVDEYGVLMGIVTLEDILEEIVGDIAERHEVRMRGVLPQPDGSWLVDGAVTIRDLNRELGWSLPDGPAATAAGLVIHESRIIPEVGQVFVFHGLRFEVVRRRRLQVALLRVARDVASG